MQKPWCSPERGGAGDLSRINVITDVQYTFKIQHLADVTVIKVITTSSKRCSYSDFIEVEHWGSEKAIGPSESQVADIF